VYGANHWKLAESHADLAEAYLDLKGLLTRWLTQNYVLYCTLYLTSDNFFVYQVKSWPLIGRFTVSCE